MKICVFITVALCVYINAAPGQAKKMRLKGSTSVCKNLPILPGAYQMNEYLPLIKGKRVGFYGNQTSMIGNTHVVDTLMRRGVKISVVFGPEHGFRGTANAGDMVENYIDSQTGLKIVSLYGKKRKPSKEDVADVDVLVFDIQDVGARFYTYISTLQDFMEAAIQLEKPLIILDRPNPNGFYVDGPVLDTAFKSFVGMQPVPVVYGLTIGEYAMFLLGEKLLKYSPTAAGKPDIKVIKCRNYTHKSKYILPVKPSPNLPDAAAVYWFPSTCFFEGTALNEGRGTDKPFQIFGHPSLPKSMYAYTPVANAGASNPKLKGQVCYGWNIAGTADEALHAINNRLQLKYLLTAYRLFPVKDSFFLRANKATLTPADYFFNKLAGNAELMQQIIDGKSEAEIRASWQPKLNEYKKKRKKYLLYADF